MGAFTAPYMDMGADERFGSGDHDRSQRRFKQITGNSPAPETVLEEVERLPCSGSTVPIQGGTGAGNELIARAIHGAGSEKERLKLLLDLTNTLVSNLELRDLLRAVSASIRQVMHCDVVGVWLPDGEQRQLRQLALDFPESKGFLREDLLHPVEGSEIGRVFQTGKPFVVGTKTDAMSEWSTPVVCAEALESGCALPLISRNRTLGVVAVASRVENSFSPEDVEFLARAAGQVAIAVENALAYREIAELKDKLAQEKLYLEEEIRTAADFEGIVGQSSAVRQVLQLVETVATSDSTVLLRGETGTGKELVARAVAAAKSERLSS